MSPAAQVVAGSVLHAGRLITQIEDGHAAARGALRELTPQCGGAQLIGVTGPPGAGKGNLGTSVIGELRGQGRRGGAAAVARRSRMRGGAKGDQQAAAAAARRK